MDIRNVETVLVYLHNELCMIHVIWILQVLFLLFARKWPVIYAKAKIICMDVYHR